MSATDVSLKAQMRRANKMNAAQVLIVGGEELANGKAQLKDMANGEQSELAHARNSLFYGPDRGPPGGGWSEIILSERFIYDLKRTHTCGQLGKQEVGSQVVLMGWAQRRRDHGGLIFVDLRDREGITQVVFNPEIDQGAHSEAHSIRSEFCLAVRGTVRARPEGMANPNLTTGDIEVYVDHFEDPQPQQDPAVHAGGLDRRGREHPPQVPLPGPSAAGDVRQPAAPAPGGGRGPGLFERPGLHGGGDPLPDQVHPRGGARLPGAQPGEPGQFLRPAPVAPALSSSF